MSLPEWQYDVVTVRDVEVTMMTMMTTIHLTPLPAGTECGRSMNKKWSLPKRSGRDIVSEGKGNGNGNPNLHECVGMQRLARSGVLIRIRTKLRKWSYLSRGYMVCRS
jgi:hypothetical protein